MHPSDAEREPNGFERFNEWRRNSLALKLITITVLVLLMLIPLGMIMDLISERRDRQYEAVQEVSRTWGSAQQITGPILTIPYIRSNFGTGSDDASAQSRIAYAHFLPEELRIHSLVGPEVRKRGIYEIPVYNADVRLEGKFPAPDFSGWSDVQEILWQHAFVRIGLSDVRAIRDQVYFQWGDTSLAMGSGLETTELIYSGLSAGLAGVSQDMPEMDFAVQLRVGGNSSLTFVPVGKETQVHMESGWNSPKSIGAFLPVSIPITKDGFTADWKVLSLNRNFPQRMQGGGHELSEAAFGTEFLVTVDEYTQNERSVKYGVLLIALTFLVFFFSQALQRVRIHFVQYILVGLALSLFYLLLLSFSEQVGFSMAYFIASGATIGLVVLYFKAITESWKLSALLLFVMAFIYGFIFVIIQLEDLALLAGSIGLFAILALVMYLSRKVDWYLIGRKRSDDIVV